MSPDVVIVGAGPAGCVAALVLARAGVKVQLVDRATFPRDKLCGDTVNPGTMAMLSRLDAGLAARIRARSVAITGMLVTGPGNATVPADYPGGATGIAVTRRDLDMLLLEAAAGAGADVMTDTPVRDPIRTPEGTVVGVGASRGLRFVSLHARVVIAADGRASKLAFGLGLARFATAPRRWAFGAYFEGVEGLSSRGEMHVRRDGYIGVAPLPSGLANVCVVREREHVGRTLAVRQASRKGSPYDLIGDAVRADPLLRERFAKARQVSETISLGPLAVDASAAGCPGLLLAGDAAGFVDPMTGDGMRFAVRGGELAAVAALRELETGRPAFEQLALDRRREFAGKWRINRALRALVDSPSGVAAVARLTSIWPAPVRTMIGIAGDVRLVRLKADTPPVLGPA